LFPFGFGLSYTTFTHSGLSVNDVYVAGTGTARFTVTNTGPRDGTDIVPVYVNQPVSDMVTPPQRLVGWARVSLKAGESKHVRVTFPASALAVSQGDINAAGPPTVQPGQYVVQLNKYVVQPDTNSITPY